MKAKCMKLVDVGDGVSFICALEFGHDLKCAPRVEGRGDRLASKACSERDGHGWQCLRLPLHPGPHKFGSEVTP
jgi:hypothetical protein